MLQKCESIFMFVLEFATNFKKDNKAIDKYPY